jgi:hypothetical protein
VLVAFFGLGFGTNLAHGDHSYWQISPLTAGSYDVGANSGVATFYHYLPDLSIAQVMFLAGVSMALLGALGITGGGAWRMRAWTAVLTAAGLAASGTALSLAGTAHLDAHGMIVIPALHDAANDRPISYTPVCGGGAVVICLNPAYATYLPVVTGGLEPVLSRIAGLPGAPVRISQAPEVYKQLTGNGIEVVGTTKSSGSFILPSGPQDITSGMFIANVALPIVARVLGITGGGQTSAAQQAVLSGLTHIGSVPSSDPRVKPVPELPQPGSPAALAARRFSALPADTQHAWLVQHLTALRAGQITLAQLP